MLARRILAAGAACAFTSLALVTTAAEAGTPQAFGSALQQTTLTTPKVPKARVYEICSKESGCIYGEWVVFAKSKTWEAHGKNVDPGIFGKFAKVGKLWYFYYEGSYSPGCIMELKKIKLGYTGFFYCEGEIREYWEMKRI